VNDLIIDALQEKGWERRRIGKAIAQLQKDALPLGLHIEVRDVALNDETPIAADKITSVTQ
jgi:hypothetical protein